MKIDEKLSELVNIPGVSGFEDKVCNFLNDELNKYCDMVQATPYKSVIAFKNSKNKKAKTILLEAHIDQIGLIVSEIDENGFISFKPIGGIDERILLSSEVYILGNKEIYGVIGAKPPHLMTKEDSQKNTEISDMLIDTGYSREQLKNFISIGDPILIKSKFLKLRNNIYSSKAMDNRAGVVSVLYCLDMLKDTEIDYNLCILFSSEEELGFNGTYKSADYIKADMAICIDVTHGYTPDCEKDSVGVFDLGCGAVICRGPNLDYSNTKELINYAKKNGFMYDIEVAGGNSGTNAWAIQNLKGGIPVILISIPLRYMHTLVETLCITDIENVGKLLSSALKGGVFFAEKID